MKFVFESELINPIASHNQSNFNRFGQVYKSKKERLYIKELNDKLEELILKDENFERFGPVPIKVKYTFGFMPPKSWSKKKRLQALNGDISPTSHQIGDWDNLCKSTQDRLNALIIEDDRYIVEGHALKSYMPCSYIKIEVEEV